MTPFYKTPEQVDALNKAEASKEVRYRVVVDRDCDGRTYAGQTGVKIQSFQEGVLLRMDCDGAEGGFHWMDVEPV